MTVQKSEAQPTVAGRLFYKQVNQFFKIGLDLLFPSQCIGCGRVDEHWCSICQDELRATPIDIFDRVIMGNIHITSTGLHGGKLQSAIHALKYENNPQIGTILGERLVTTLQQKAWIIDMVIPVPLHTNKLKQRGYNQSQILSEVIEDTLSLPCEPQAITRYRETHSQVGLSQKERAENMINAFQANADLLTNKTILIIDDVLTTGATLGACAQSALKAGANKIYGLTITTASTL